MGLCERTGVVSGESYGLVPISIPGQWSDLKLAGNGSAEIGAVRGSCDRDGGCRENFQWLCGRPVCSSLIDGGTKTLEQGRIGGVQGILGGGGDEFSGRGRSVGALNDCGVAEGLRSCHGASTITSKVCGLLTSYRSKQMPSANVARCS